MSMLQRSPYVRSVRDGGNGTAMVYHALYGNPRIMNDAGLVFLGLFEDARDTDAVAGACDGDPTDLLQDLQEISFLVPEGCDEKAILRERRQELLQRVQARATVDRMGLAISDACNLGCTHCLHFQPRTGGDAGPSDRSGVRSRRMDWATAQACVDRYVSIMREQGATECKVHFGNAEPLLNWRVIERVLAYCAAMTELTFEFSINTNLVLLTPAMAEMLKRHRVRIATSLDGVGATNDAIRTTKDGAGTYAQILEKFDLLDAIGYPLDGFSVTVTSGNYHLIDTSILEFAARRGMTSIAFDYDLIGLVQVAVAERVDKLLTMRRYANERGIDFFGTWDSAFRNLLSASLLTGDHAFCAAVQGKSLEFNVDGSIKVCGHTTTTVGHVSSFDDLFRPDGGLVRMVATRYPGTEAYCSGCAIEGPCGGQCHVTREVVARSRVEERERLFADLCDFYRAVTDGLIVDHLRSEGLTMRVSTPGCSL